MTELATRPIQIINPQSGELLTLDSPTDDLGRYLAAAREHKACVQEAINAVSREILRRQDQAAAAGESSPWTTRIGGGLKLVGSSPAAIEEWDGADLKAQLLTLVDEGLLSPAAVDAAVETIVTFKVKKTGVNALRKLGGRVKELIDQLATEREPDRRITVSRIT